MNITVIGTGYVGLVAGACFAEIGNEVICVDKDSKKIKTLSKGIVPIYEPGLEEIVKRNLKEERLSFTTSLKDGINFGDIIFIAVGTPSDQDGSADLSGVVEVAELIGKTMKKPKIIVTKSTVPVGTASLVEKTIKKVSTCEFSVVSNPEFLKEGAAVDDFLNPDRVIIGASDQRAVEVMKELYAPFVRNNNPVLVMDNASAEMSKYASNVMLASRITLMNEIALLCQKAGADIESVRQGVGTDARIGMSFLFPGIGYGGSCFPKDIRALIHIADELGVLLEIPKAIELVNARQKLTLVDKIKAHYKSKVSGKTFAVWGLSFKPRTDDVREAPSLVVCTELLKLGAKLQVFDPEANKTFRSALGDRKGITYYDTNYDALKGADALIICTEWNEFRRPNFDKMKSLLAGHVIFDGRNLYSLDKMKKFEFSYYSVGRPSV